MTTDRSGEPPPPSGLAVSVTLLPVQKLGVAGRISASPGRRAGLASSSSWAGADTQPLAAVAVTVYVMSAATFWATGLAMLSAVR